jgi:hypothetical protein
MGLMDALRHAEQSGKRTAHQGAERLKKGIQNAEASIRHAAHPNRKGATPTHPVSTHADLEQERESRPSSKVRTGIISVNGRDVGEMRCTGGRGTS